MTLDRRTLLTAAAVGAACPLVAPGAASAAPRLSRVLARGLVVPWGLSFLPNGDALVTERASGRVQRVDKAGGTRLVGTIAAAADRGEGGLLGVAVSPRFTDDHWVYFYLTTASDNRIIRKRYDRNGLGPTEVLLSGIPSANNHNGGRLAFGPDGHLYAGTGDAGHDLGRPLSESWAQDRDNLAGKILRMTPNGGVPGDNPFGNYTWSYGHRNVQGLTWDGRGRMWATELGQNTRDELNRIVRGGNYGWPAVEGGDAGGPFADPFAVWSPTSTCSPSGVATARGRAWVGALRGESLYSVRLDGPNAGRKVRHFNGELGRIRTVQKAPDGSLWITTSNRDGRGTPRRRDDKVLRIVV